jgi:hypothetical protein
MNATIIMISQGAMVFGGVIWSSAVAVAGPIYTLLGASALFLVSLLLAGRLSINVRTDLEEKVSVARFAVEVEEVTPTALTRDLCTPKQFRLDHEQAQQHASVFFGRIAITH